MTRILVFFKSVKLAIVLILYLAITSILATIIPQGKDPTFYYALYPSLVAAVVIFAQLHRFFQSFLFLVPAIVFFVNLSVCSVDRFARELRGKTRKRFSVDLVHIGMLLLIVGGIISSFGRQEGFTYLGEGDQIRLPGDRILQLKSFEFHQYPDGRPKDWISVVDVQKNGTLIVDSFAIEVNRPLKVGPLNIYQSSYSHEEQIVFQDAQGDEHVASQDEFIRTEAGAFRFKGISAAKSSPGRPVVVFEKWEGHSAAALLELPLPQKLGEYVLKNVTSRDLTGLQFVIDPGVIPVIVALIMITAGLAWTYLLKIKEKPL